jgi:hypothetical protein
MHDTLEYECNVNFVKLPLIWIYWCLKLIFENANSGRNVGWRLVVYRAGNTTFKETAGHNHRTYQATRLSLRPPRLPSSGEIRNRCDDRRGSHEGVYRMKKQS